MIPPAGDPSEAVRLSGKYNSTRTTVMIERVACNDCPLPPGREAMLWILSQAIQGIRRTPTGQRRGVLYITWRRHRERLERRQFPTDFDGLASLVRAGWEFDATVGLPGGMDNTQSGAGNVQPGQAEAAAAVVTVNFASMSTDDYQKLDEVVRDVLAGRSTEGKPLGPVVRALLAHILPQDWASLTDPIFGEISPARILALRAIVHGNAATLRDIPLAPWVGQAHVVGLQFCDVQPSLAGWTGGSVAEAKRLITGELMRIEGLGTAPTFDWQTTKDTLRVDGELSPTGADKVWTVQAVVPQGPWVRDLLTGATALVPGSYTVLMPSSPYLEVTLDSKTTQVLKSLRRLLGLDSALFRAMIRHALGQRLGADMIMVRISTSAFLHGGEGKKGKSTFFSPDHSDAKIVCGVDATLLLQAGRIAPTLALELGLAPTFPVSLTVPCPAVPGFVLKSMRSITDGIAIRYRDAGARPTTRDVILGYVGAGVDITQTGAHLPAGWLSDRLVNSQAQKFWALQLLRQAFQREVGATTMLPVGRLKKGGGDPAYMFVMFPTIAAATLFCGHIDARTTLPTALREMLGTFLDPNGRLVTFCAYIPPESIADCIEKDITQLVKAGLTDAAIIRPVAAPDAPV